MKRWLRRHGDVTALAAWACVAVGAGLALAGVDGASKGDAVEITRALIGSGVVLALTGGGACMVLAGRAQ